MTVKNDVQVVIDGKMITLSGYESNEYMQEAWITQRRQNKRIFRK